MAEFEQFKQNVQNFSRGMTFGQKVTIGGTFILTIIGFVLLLRWATKPDYVLLYSNLDLKEADQIVEALNTAGVPYRIAAGGHSIQIPSKDVYEWRMKLASQGLPSSGGIGYEVFDKKEIGISDFVQKVNYRRALEGELARTIRGISGVQNARVHIVIPEQRLFKEDQQEASASIVLQINNNMRVSESQIQGITRLVAASVEGLSPDNVTVVDSKGNILSNQWNSDSVIGLSSTQHELQQKVESYLENKAQSMLASVLGNGKAIVRVSAKLNFQRIEQTNEIYNPNTVVLSEETTTESTTESAGQPSGEIEHIITNYQVPKTVEYITNSVGDIERLSVSVLVDGTYNTTVDASGGEQKEYVERTPQEMTTLTAVVRNAVGFYPQRGDQLTIQNIPFESQRELVAPGEPNMVSQPDFWLSLAQKVVPAVFLIVLLFILRAKLRKVKLSLPPPTVPVGRAMVAGPVIEDVAIPRIEDSASPEAVERAKLMKQISNFASEKPSMAARLLRYWMIEE